MLKIRLARGGAKKRPYYSIVVADSHSPRDGRFIEKVGAYNPLLKKDDAQRLVIKSERVTAWLAKGAQPTERVARFLSTQGLAAWEHGDNPKKGEPHAKAKERVKEREERAAAMAAAEAEAAETAAQAMAEEATAEDAPRAEAADAGGAPAEEARSEESGSEEPGSAQSGSNESGSDEPSAESPA